MTLLFVWVSVADASDVLLGTVVAVDRSQGRITLRVIDTSGGGGGQSSPESLTVITDPEKIPGNLSAGDTVRVWGDYASGGRATFRADAIQKSGAGGGADPTGVRSRLGQRGGQGSGQGGGQGAGGRQSGRR